MLLKTTGIVLKRRSIGEYDGIVTILTKELGLIEATVNGVKRIKSAMAGATQMLVYGEFCLYKGKKYYSVNSAETLESFYDLRLDVEKLALASYFCDLTHYLLPEGVGDTWPFLRLLLNTLSFLKGDQRNPLLLKVIYELRMLSLSGFMPDLVGCTDCGTFEDEKMKFYPLSGNLRCGNCATQTDSAYVDAAPPAVLLAMRHIIYAEDAKLFSFRMTGSSLLNLCYLTEHYLLLQTEKEFKSLSVFWQLHIPIDSGTENQTEKL